MKSVTIENVKARIGELVYLEATGHLTLKAEFELACLRQLVAGMQQKPFMYGIADPDGAAHMDECCVSTSMAGIEDYVHMLNEECEEGGPLYKAVALYRHYQPAPERQQVRADHAEWSQATFGNVGPIGPLKHLAKEALEAAAAPGDLSEWADMQFLLWDAQRRPGITDEQITQAMIDKLAVNKARQWPEPKDGEPRLHIQADNDNTAQQFEALATSQHGSCSNCGGTGAGTRYTGGECPQCLGSGGVNESTSKLDARRRRNRQANARARARETPEQANQRRAANRERMWAARSGKQ